MEESLMGEVSAIRRKKIYQERLKLKGKV